MDTLSFHLHTQADVHGLRQVFRLPENLFDDDVVAFAQQKYRVLLEEEIFPHHLQKITAITYVLRYGEKDFYIRTLNNGNEEKILTDFFYILETIQPHLICRQQPKILLYRSFINGISTPSFDWLNAVDDFVSSQKYLDDLSILCGFPLLESFDKNSQEEVQTLNDYLIYLRYALSTNAIDADQYHQEIVIVHHFLSQYSQYSHWQTYLREWQ